MANQQKGRTMAKTTQQGRENMPAITFEGLVAITKDPADATLFALDLFALTAHRAQRALAVRAGLPEPSEPKPLSRFVRTFRRSLKAKTAAVIDLLDANERARLTKVAPAFSRRLDRADWEITEEVVRLLAKEPEDIAAWLREHLDEIETRFAS